MWSTNNILNIIINKIGILIEFILCGITCWHHARYTDDDKLMTVFKVNYYYDYY